MSCMGQAGQHALAGLVTILMGGQRGVERAADKLRTEEVVEVGNVAKRIRGPAVLPEDGLLIVPHFLALALARRLLIFIIGPSEVGALQRARQANNVSLGREPVGPQIKR